VKANIGHLEAASGVASLIKTVLVLRHGMVPPQRGLEALNPDIPWGEFGVEVPRTAKEFPKEGGGGRFGGVSSFGIGGTNAHVVLEGCDEEVAAQSPAALVLPLSAHCPEALREMAAGYAAAFARANAMEARDICLHTARTRGEMSHRLVVVGEDQASLGRGLADYLAGRNSASCFEGSVNTKRRHKVAFLFTGQGTQHAGMGSRLYDEEPVFREVIDRCQARIERGRQGISLRDFFAANDENGAALAKSAFMQPALYALQCGLLELLKSCGVEADVVMGHSAGEYAAACAAGIFSVEDGLDMLIERGYLTDTFVKPGAMLSVLCSHAQLEPILRECSARVWVAAFNGPSSVVLSGTPDEIRAVRAVLQRERVLTQGIEVGHPFHSSLIEPILPRLEERFSGIGLHRPRIPFVSSVTGALVESEPSEARYWREHSRLPVSFAQGIATVHELGVRVFVEIGPRPMLLSMARGCIPEGKDLFWLPALRPTVSAPTQLARLLGALHALGVPVNWAAREGGNAVPRARLSLPRYPFQRKSHWVEQGRTAPRPLPRPSGAFSLPGRRLPGDEGETHERSWVCRVDPVLGKWLGAHAIGADWAVSFAGLVKWVFAAAAAAPRARLPTIAPLKVLEPLLFGAEGRDVLTHWAASESNGARLTIWNADGNDWARSAWAQLREPGDLSAEPLATVRERLGVAAWEEPDGREPDLEVRFFRAVRFWKTERESLGLFAIHRRELGDGSCEECHPAILDGLAKTFRQVAPPGLDAMVPTAAAEIEWRGKITERVWCHAILGGEHAESGLLGDLFVHDEKGQLVVGIRGLRFVPATLRRDELASLAYRISLETVGTPVADEPRLRNSFWHVAGEGDALQAAILHELRLAGARCDGWSTLSREGRDKTGGESLEVIFVAGGHEGPDDCLRLLTLQRELTALRESRIGLWVYTCGAQNGDTPWAATVWGLARSIFREHAAWDGGVCDLDPQDDVGARSVAILSTLGRTQRSGSCWRGRQLSDVVLEPTWSLDRCRPLVLKEDRSYLITGGLGGIGRELAGWLCGKGARRLLLVGRSEPDSTAEAMLESWRSGGIEVETFRGDVGDARDCERLESLPWLRVHPPAGIFHLAGILRDVPLSDESEEGFRRTLSGKAQGAWHLHELSRAWDLDHFVLFSSVAGLVPNVGQAAYASANAFLDGLAVHRRKVGLPALSVDWGTWARVGHAASAHGARVHAELANRGVLPIESDTAFQILESLMGCEEAQTGVIRADFRRLVRVDRDLARWSLLRRVLGEDTAGGVDARPQFGSLATPELRERIRRELREKLAFVLELRELPGVDAGFRDLGLDSFVGLRFRSDVERTFGCSLPVTAIFEFPTVAELTEYLLSLIRPGSAAAAAEDRDLPQEVAEVTVPGPVGSKLERLESLLNRFNGARDA
jgi:malonyl CoA-acyl carrier protein transacylase/acyl carrier protein